MKEFLITMAWGVFGLVVLAGLVIVAMSAAFLADSHPWIVKWVCVPVVVVFFTFCVGCWVRAIHS